MTAAILSESTTDEFSFLHIERPIIDTVRFRETESLIKMNSWFQIVSSPDHFLTTYLLQLAKSHINDIRVKPNLDDLEISCHINKYIEFKQSVEKIRTILIKGSDSSTSELFFINTTKLFLFVNEEEIMFISQNPNTPQIDFYSNEYLEATLKALDLKFEITFFKKQVPDSPYPQDITKYKIYWQEIPHHTFLVPPEGLPKEDPPNSLNTALFECRKTFGDFEFLTRTDPVILHKCVLYAKGPDALKGMLQIQMKETTTNTYDMTRWSQEAVELFVEYIYFGHHHIAQKLYAYNDIPKENVLELLEMAHMYHISGLFDCACNALSACATPEDLPRLLTLAKVYESRFLLDLNYKLGLKRRAQQLAQSFSSIKV